MLFNSVEFLLAFLPIVLIVYYLLPHRQQNAFLVLASCFFYASWDWRFLLPLLCTTGLDYWVAGQLEASHQRGAADAPRRKRLLWVSVAANLSLLGFFKYCNFFIESTSAVLTALGFGPRARRVAGAELRVVEDHVRYLREFRVVDAVEVHSGPVEVGERGAEGRGHRRSLTTRTPRSCPHPR